MRYGYDAVGNRTEMLDTGKPSVPRWAETARASTEGGAAALATGAPDVSGCDLGGWQGKAWTPDNAREGPEWLEVGFGSGGRARGIRVHETSQWATGFVVRVDLLAEDGTAHAVYAIQSESVEFDLPEGLRREAWRMEGVGGTIFGASLPDGRVIVLAITFPGAAQMSDRLTADPEIRHYRTTKTLGAVAFPPNRGEARKLVRHMVSVGDWAVDIQASSSDADRAQKLARAVAETVERRRADRALEVKTEASPLLLRCFEARRFAAGWVKRTICFRIQAQREADEKLAIPAGERKTFPGAWRVIGDQLVLCEANGLRSQATYDVGADGLTFGDEKWALAR